MGHSAPSPTAVDIPCIQRLLPFPTVARDKKRNGKQSWHILQAATVIVVGIHHGESSSLSIVAYFHHGMKKIMSCRNVDIHATNDCSLFPTMARDKKRNLHFDSLLLARVALPPSVCHVESCTLTCPPSCCFARCQVSMVPMVGFVLKWWSQSFEF